MANSINGHMAYFTASRNTLNVADRLEFREFGETKKSTAKAIGYNVGVVATRLFALALTVPAVAIDFVAMPLVAAHNAMTDYSTRKSAKDAYEVLKPICENRDIIASSETHRDQKLAAQERSFTSLVAKVTKNPSQDDFTGFINATVEGILNNPIVSKQFAKANKAAKEVLEMDLTAKVKSASEKALAKIIDAQKEKVLDPVVKSEAHALRSGKLPNVAKMQEAAAKIAKITGDTQEAAYNEILWNLGKTEAVYLNEFTPDMREANKHKAAMDRAVATVVKIDAKRSEENPLTEARSEAIAAIISTKQAYLEAENRARAKCDALEGARILLANLALRDLETVKRANMMSDILDPSVLSGYDLTNDVEMKSAIPAIKNTVGPIVYVNDAEIEVKLAKVSSLFDGIKDKAPTALTYIEVEEDEIVKPNTLIGRQVIAPTYNGSSGGLLDLI